MKVYMGNYRYHWNTQAMDRAWYKMRYDKSDWEIPEKDWDRWDHAYEKFAEISRLLICRPVNWVKSKIPRIEYVKIDPYDTWSADSTLAPIILKLMVQLREKQHGAPYTDDNDVPEHLRSTNAAPKENEYDTDSLHFERWDWIMGEIIWAFEQLVAEDQGEDQFRTGFSDIMFQAIGKNGEPIGAPYELGFEPDDVKGNENVSCYRLVDGPRHTRVTDFKGLESHHKRIQNGLLLFGKYYRALWD